MSNVKFYLGEDIPLELHKVRMVQKLYLVPIERRLEAIKDAGFNTFRLSTKDVYLDMLTDSGTNAMSDNQISAMLPVLKVSSACRRQSRRCWARNTCFRCTRAVRPRT